MTRPSMKAGFIGVGFAARFHHEMLQRVYAASVDVVAVYSPTRERRERFAAERGIRAVDSPAAVIEAADVVHVCSPPSSHEDNVVAALAAGKHVVVEKPFTGYFGDGGGDFSGIDFDRESGLTAATESIMRMREAEAQSAGTIAYAENWVYAPALQKEREIIEKTGSQILWLKGEESHSGSHAPYYGIWSFSGGGSLMGKGVHPLTAMLYLKKVEGRVRDGRPIRPISVSARTHSITRLPGFQDAGHLRTDYKDVEDFGFAHIVFEDGTVADMFATELVLGGVHNWLEVMANNHRGVVSINPNNALQTYNPSGPQFDDIYVVEKIGTKEGWANTSPDEDWFTGYQHEMQAFYDGFITGTPHESDSLLAADTISTVYAAYLSASRAGAEVGIPLV